MKKLMMRKDASMSLDNVAKNPTLYYGVDYDDVFDVISKEDARYISHLQRIIEATEDDNESSSSKVSGAIVSIASALPAILMYLATNAEVVNVYSKVLAVIAALIAVGLALSGVYALVKIKNNKIRQAIRVACEEALEQIGRA